MITAVNRCWEHLAGVKERYELWERRQVDKRFRTWSTRRRLVFLGWLPLALALCCGGTVAVPVLWAVQETVDAGRGAPSPDAAANEYLMRLSYGQDEGLLPLLDDQHQGRLIKQWRAYRNAMLSARPPASRLVFGTLDAEAAKDDRAIVRADVQAMWLDTDEAGRLGGYSSPPLTWVIETRQDDGWRVARVEAPPWCGDGGYVLRCHDEQPPPVPPAAAPSASPSHDLLQHPREMLRCGERDPFREMHSCPPTR
jgi:hypothetical protein